MEVDEGVTTIEEERKKGRREEGDLNGRVGCRGEREMTTWGEKEMVLVAAGEKGRWQWPKKAAAWGEREMVVAKDDDDNDDGDGG
ncbi:hypothetical protein B296_00052118 [Ensete ventricosum]|uniref:Uncharacterized protein n=1 Tax=Ensete ventricosum TaxID=4639 RepID=A0A426XL72_ENSVE|nr:hypothetical protein B296_00052118 [Ensete ventricosum]